LTFKNRVGFRATAVIQAPRLHGLLVIIAFSEEGKIASSPVEEGEGDLPEIFQTV
jgi:hypothetical protein